MYRLNIPLRVAVVIQIKLQRCKVYLLCCWVSSIKVCINLTARAVDLVTLLRWSSKWCHLGFLLSGPFSITWRKQVYPWCQRRKNTCLYYSVYLATFPSHPVFPKKRGGHNSSLSRLFKMLDISNEANEISSNNRWLHIAWVSYLFTKQASSLHVGLLNYSDYTPYGTRPVAQFGTITFAYALVHIRNRSR